MDTAQGQQVSRDGWSFPKFSSKIDDMALPDADWRRLGDLVVERRNELGMSQGDVAAAGGPSVATMRIIEGALQTNYRGTVLGRLEQALRWAPGSVKTILEGGDPRPQSEAERRPSARSMDDELREMRDNTDLPQHLRRQAQAQLDSIAALLEAAREADGRNRRAS